MPFEFDPRKSEANAGRHGIDFVAAQALWADPDLLEIPAKTTGELRYLVLGRIGERHYWTSGRGQLSIFNISF